MQTLPDVYTHIRIVIFVGATLLYQFSWMLRQYLTP
jgi:hypothetical protein